MVSPKKAHVTMLSAFQDRGVPGPTSEMSPRAPAQMGRRETEQEGGNQRRETCKKGNPRPSCCPAPRSGALAVGGYKRPRGREREAHARRPVPPRGQPSRTRALDLPFIDVRRGPRCTMGGCSNVLMCLASGARALCTCRRGCRRGVAAVFM